MVRACAEVESTIPRDAWPVVLVDHSMEFLATIVTIAKLCRRIIGTSGRHLGREERQITLADPCLCHFSPIKM